MPHLIAVSHSGWGIATFLLGSLLPKIEISLKENCFRKGLVKQIQQSINDVIISAKAL